MDSINEHENSGKQRDEFAEEETSPEKKPGFLQRQSLPVKIVLLALLIALVPITYVASASVFDTGSAGCCPTPDHDCGMNQTKSS